MSAVLVTLVFAGLLLRHVGAITQFAVIVRDDLGEARARRAAALHAWDQQTRH